MQTVSTLAICMFTADILDCIICMFWGAALLFGREPPPPPWMKPRLPYLEQYSQLITSRQQNMAHILTKRSRLTNGTKHSLRKLCSEIMLVNYQSRNECFIICNNMWVLVARSGLGVCRTEIKASSYDGIQKSSLCSNNSYQIGSYPTH